MTSAMRASNAWDSLLFVSAVSNVTVFEQRLLASPCIQSGQFPLVAHFNCSSAAQALNAALDSGPGVDWVVWVHQDVFLPEGWATRFLQAVNAAALSFTSLAVAGVYGVQGRGRDAVRAGHVLDRGCLLREPTALPCAVDSLDELLLAVRPASGLRLDPALGFDFYATDLVLQAQQAGLQSIVVDACCEHWSGTPARGVVSAAVRDRIVRSASVFEQKWQSQLPVTTPCFVIESAGDVQRFVDQFTWVSP